jgi:hypothetical protein
MKAPVKDISANEFKPLSMYGPVSPVFDRGIGSRRAGTFDTAASYQWYPSEQRTLFLLRV